MLRAESYKHLIESHFDSRVDYGRGTPQAGLADRLVQLAAPQLNEHVLDIATGSGFIALQVAKRVGNDGKVLGVDLSAGMLEQARVAIAHSHLSNITLMQADAETLSADLGLFDLIICCNALPYMSDVPASLRNWYTLLRPGGRFAFNCWAYDSHATGHLLRQLAAQHGIRVAVVGDEIGTPKRCYTTMEKAGYVEIQVIIDSTSRYLSPEQLASFPAMALKNPIYGLTDQDRSRLMTLQEEYHGLVQSESLKKEIDAENGAYFIVARKSVA